jgi:hypothetical protein
VNSELEQLHANRLRPGIVQEGLMKIVQINGRPVTSKWARILILFWDLRGLRLQTDLSLPCGNQWIWEFRMRAVQELFQVKGIIIRQNTAADHEHAYEYEARFIMDEQHPLTIRMKESYNVQATEAAEAAVRREVKLDLFG